MQKASEDLPGGIPGFTIEKLLGKGGLGCVYLAHQHALDRPVAFKVLRADRDQDPGVFRRFLREAKVMARVDHPNLVRLFEFLEEDLGPAITMEYFPCGTLRSEIEALAREKKTLGEKRSLQLAVEMVSALEALHQVGVVHRDVKPTNIFLRDSSEAVLGDLGASSRASDEETEITSAGVLVGTASYMAPELWSGQPATPMADIFALGITLHECLTGCHPHPQRITGPEFQFAWSRDHVKEISRPTRELVEKMLSRDPARRAVDLQYLLKILPDTGVSINLEKLTASLGGRNKPPPPLLQPREKQGRRQAGDPAGTASASSRTVLVISVVVSSLLSFGVGLMLRARLEPPAPVPSITSTPPSPVPTEIPVEDSPLALRERLLSRYRGTLSNVAPELKARRLGTVPGRFGDRLWLGWEQVEGGAPPGTATIVLTCFDPAGEQLRLVFPDWTPPGPLRVSLNGQTLTLETPRNTPPMIELPGTALRFGINRVLLIPEKGTELPDGIRGVLHRRGSLPLPASRPLEDENPAVLARLGPLYERMRKGSWKGTREEVDHLLKQNPDSVRLASLLTYIDAGYVLTCRDMDRMGLQGMDGTSGMLVMTDLLPDLETALRNLSGSLVTLHGGLSRNPHRGIVWSKMGLVLATGGEIEQAWRSIMYGALLDPDDINIWISFTEVYSSEEAMKNDVARAPDFYDPLRIAKYLAQRAHLEDLAKDIDRIVEKAKTFMRERQRR